MSTVTISPGALVQKDPSDVKVYVVDWDASSLAVGAAIQTSTWTITALRPNPLDTALTKDNEGILNAAQATTALQGVRTVTADNRVTQVRLLAGTLNQTYEIANKIVTNESPAQTKERSFQVLVVNQ